MFFHASYLIVTFTHSLVLLPQILNPNPDAMSKMITENASEEFLHSLSNYCALQVWMTTNLAKNYSLKLLVNRI